MALPDEALRALSSDYIKTLPARVQRTIRKRLAGPSPSKTTSRTRPGAKSKATRG